MATDSSASASPGIPTPMPDSLSPVFVKELRQGLRAQRFVLPFVMAQVFAVIAIGSEFGISSVAAGAGSTGMIGSLIIVVVWIALGVIMPVTHLAALRPELADGRNIELLLMSNLNRWQIVRGKWMVGFALSGLMLISMTPYLLTRYFIGGVDLIQTLHTVLWVVFVNAAFTALAIGASGFGNLLGRFVILIVGLLSYWGAIGGAAFVFFRGIAGATGSFLPALWAVLASALVTALYVAFGLQLGRSRLRLFDNPLDPPASGLVIALMIFTPIIVGVTAAATAGYGGAVAVAGLLVLTLVIDRGPGRDSAARYAQP